MREPLWIGGWSFTSTRRFLCVDFGCSCLLLSSPPVRRSASIYVHAAAIPRHICYLGQSRRLHPVSGDGGASSVVCCRRPCFENFENGGMTLDDEGSSF